MRCNRPLCEKHAVTDNSSVILWCLTIICRRRPWQFVEIWHFKTWLLRQAALFFAATEAALRQDGPAATLTGGSFARLLGFNPANGNPLAEYVYEVAPINQAPIPLTAFAVNGLARLWQICNFVDLFFVGSLIDGEPA